MKVAQGDITTLEVDAIVNAANQVMLGGGGVDGAIHRAAGKELFDACLKVPEVRSGVRCSTGEARITPGFKLPAKFVIHTVGPVYRDGRHITAPCGGSRPVGGCACDEVVRLAEAEGRAAKRSQEPARTRRAKRVPSEPEKLANCYRNSLALASENGCKSVAFPCISTGVYGYPIEDAAKIAIRETQDFLKKRDDIQVVFCCFSSGDRKVYEKLISSSPASSDSNSDRNNESLHFQ